METYDGIIASRYLPGAKVYPKQSTGRIIASRAFNIFVRSFFPSLSFKDTQCGAKIFKKEAISKIVDKISTTQWAFDINLLYELQKAGLSIKEEPTTWSDTEYSKLNLKSAGLRMFLSILRLRILNSNFKWLIDVYNKMPEWIKIHHRI